MVARIPLIVNPDAAQIQELPAGDTLDLPVVTLTADGTIADKAAVVLTSAGKAKTISSVGETQIAGTVFHTGSGTEAVYTLHDGAWFGDEGVVVGLPGRVDDQNTHGDVPALEALNKGVAVVGVRDIL